MYDKNSKKFCCDSCGKQILSGEKCWTKWNFPPKITASQMKAIKELEFENAPILCLECADKIMTKKY